MSRGDSFDTFYRASRQRLYDCLHVLTGDAVEAQDVVHEAYARAWQRWSTVGDHADPEAWVRTVARRIAVSRWRRVRSALRAYGRTGPSPALPGPDPDSLPLAAAASAELDRVFERLRGQRPPNPFAPPETVRRRGRLRSRHQAIAVSLVVVAATATGTGWAVGIAPADRTVTTEPTRPAASTPANYAPASSTPATAAATGQPASADPGDLSARLLTHADLGPGAWLRREHLVPFEGPDRWAWAFYSCSGYRSANYPSLRQQLAVEVGGYGMGDDGPYLNQHIHRYAPGWGVRAMADVRRVLDDCAQTGPPPASRAVVDSGFAGQESLLIRQEQRVYDGETLSPMPFVTFAVVVRVDDLVTTVTFSPDRDAAHARSMAQAAARRLAG